MNSQADVAIAAGGGLSSNATRPGCVSLHSNYEMHGYTPNSSNGATASVNVPVPALSSSGSASTLNQSLLPFTTSRTFDTSGQVAPPGLKPLVTASLWEDEATVCFQVEAKGVCVARREDNHMINGTKLLNVAGMTRGCRDGILKSEKAGNVVRIGPMHLKGMWIPFERALEFANMVGITEKLYPLFVHDIRALLSHPSNQTRTAAPRAPVIQPGRSSAGTTSVYATHSMDCHHHTTTSGRPILNIVDPFPTPPTSAPSSLGMELQELSYEWDDSCAQTLDQASRSTTPWSMDSYDNEDFSTNSHETEIVLDNMRLNPHSPEQSGTSKVEKEVTQSVSVSRQRPLGVLPIELDSVKEEPFNSADNPTAGMLSASPTSDTESSHATTESTRSLGSYEDTSDDDSHIDLHKQRTIDRIMVDFYKMFDRTAKIAQRPVREQAGQGNQSVISTTIQCSKNQASQRQSKKRRADDEAGKDESGDETQKRAKRAQTGISEEPGRRLACPYFKHNPQKYRNVHPCLGPGWTSIHRLKEHLYRRHELAPQCTRCCQAFDSDSKLREHSRLPEGCDLRTADPLEGFDKDQERRLRSRKKGVLADSKEDQWKEIYLILFPDTLLPEIPSSYYDYDEDTKQESNHSPTSAGFARYEAYLSRELPRSVRRELELAMENELGPIEEKLKSQLELIVRNCQERLFKIYQDAIQSNDEGGDSDLVETEIPCEAGPSNSMDTASNLLAISATDDLAAYQVPPEIPFQFWNNFLEYPGREGNQSSDSAYNSLPLDPSWSSETFDFDSNFAQDGFPTWEEIPGNSVEFLSNDYDSSHSHGEG